MLCVSATACKRIIAELKAQRRQNRTLRRRGKRFEKQLRSGGVEPAAAPAKKSRKPRELPTGANVTQKAVYNRGMRMANHSRTS